MVYIVTTMDDQDDKKQNNQTSETHVEEEESISGSAPAPGSDDDTLTNAQQMGEQLDEDEEHPKEVNIARDVDKAEEHHRTD